MNHSFTMRNTVTEDKLTNTFAYGDKTTGDAPTARTGLALCHKVILDSVAHWWVPARTPTLHQCLYGGRPWVARDTRHHHNDKQDQGCHATPWSPTYCLKYLNEGIVYCTCGTCTKYLVKSRKLNKDSVDVLSIPNYVLKKGPSRGARHGPTERQRHLLHCSQLTEESEEIELQVNIRSRITTLDRMG